MNPFNDIPEALQRMSTFMIASGADLPAPVQEALSGASAQPSPVDRIVQFGKAIHEHRDSLATEVLTIAAEAIEFAARHGWHGLDADGPALITELLGAA